MFRRSHGITHFESRTFQDYRDGFGIMGDEFWLGLDKINLLSTKDTEVQLRIELSDCEGRRGYQVYDQFSVNVQQDGLQ